MYTRGVVRVIVVVCIIDHHYCTFYLQYIHKWFISIYRHDENEGSTEGIDLSFSCSFNLSQRQAWQVAISDNDVKEQDHDNLSKTDGNNIRNKFLLFVFFKWLVICTFISKLRLSFLHSQQSTVQRDTSYPSEKHL